MPVSERNRLHVFALMLGAAVVFSGCGRTAARLPAKVENYAMRGEIVRLPAAGENDIAIRHEAVPDFRDEGGKVVGMQAMTMPFSLAPDASISGLVPGDRVAFTLEMRWQEPREIARVARLEKLPADARLSWEQPASAQTLPPRSTDGGKAN